MNTITAREIMSDMWASLPDSDSLSITDSRRLMGQYGEAPTLECGGCALVMDDDTGEDGNDEPNGYTWTSFRSTPEGKWEEAGTGYARDEEEARTDIAIWFDELPR